MRLYMISPRFNAAVSGLDATRPYLDGVAEVIADALCPTGDEILIGVWHSNEVNMDAEPFDTEHAGKRLRAVSGRESLRSVLRRLADPWDYYFMWIRSQTTCRSVLFGYDGQAFLCLRLVDAVPKGSTLICVEERSELLSESDYFDG